MVVKNPPINMEPRKELVGLSKNLHKVVIWGLRSQWHSHRFIHQGFYETLRRLGVPVVWTDYGASPGVIESGDLVITSNAHGRLTSKNTLAPLREGAYYCFHGFGGIPYQIDSERYIRLEVFTRAALKAEQRWDEATYFDPSSRTLYQAWGTNLFEEDFRQPTASRLPVVFWVGAIWNNELDQGNVRQIAELKRVLRDRSLRFVHLKYVPNSVSLRAVRLSRIAPAIAGQWQVENDYLPCRMFKNISYGQLGISNVRWFRNLYHDCSVPGDSIEDLVDNALSMSPAAACELSRTQQRITRNHTYVHKLRNILGALLRNARPDSLGPPTADLHSPAGELAVPKAQEPAMPGCNRGQA